jgi:hypothetical protein
MESAKDGAANGINSSVCGSVRDTGCCGNHLYEMKKH